MKNYNQKQIFKYRARKWLSWIMFFIVCGFTAYFFKVNPWALFLIGVSTFGIYLSNIFEEKETYYSKGEAGELEIEKELSNINNIVVYRDVVLGEDNQWNIDFVVVADSGVYVIEVKAYEGKITANGDSWYRYINNKRRPVASFSKQAKLNAANLNSYMKEKFPDKKIPFVKPVVCLVKPFNREDIKVDEEKKVLVVSPDELFDMFEKSKVISSELVNTAIDCLDKITVREAV